MNTKLCLQERKQSDRKIILLQRAKCHNRHAQGIPGVRDLCVCSGVAVNKERSEEGETGLGCKLQVGVSREMCMRRGGKHAM